MTMNRAQRSQQLWSLLSLAANNNQILTYDTVAKLTGVVRPSIGDFLRPIQQYCTEKSLPPLTSIVVSEKDGLPGDGFIAASNIPLAHITAFKMNWLSIQAPSEEDLEDAYNRIPDEK